MPRRDFEATRLAHAARAAKLAQQAQALWQKALHLVADSIEAERREERACGSVNGGWSGLTSLAPAEKLCSAASALGSVAFHAGHKV